MAANIARLTKDMADAKRTVEGAMSGIEKSVSMAKQALGALGIGLGVGMLVHMVKGSIDAMDSLRDLSKTTTIAIEDLAGLKLAAKQSGGDLEGIAASINKLAQNMGKDAEKFKALGVTARDPLKAFQQLADVFVSIQNPQLRAAVAAEALGKSWAGAAPLLSEGGKKIGEMVETGKRLSGVTKEMADQADEFNDRMAEISTTLGGAKTKIVGNALLAFNEISKAIAEAAKESGGLTAAWVALGGAAAFILGQTDTQKLRERLKEVNDQLEVARKQLAAGSLKPAGASTSFFGFLIPDVRLGEDVVKRLREVIAELEREKRTLETVRVELSKFNLEQDRRELARVGSVSGRGQAEAAAEAFLRGKLDEEKIAIAHAKTMLEINRDFIDQTTRNNEFSYKEGLIDLNEFFTNRHDIIEEKLRVDLQGIQQLLAAQRAALNKPGAQPPERTAAQIEINRLLAQEPELARKAAQDFAITEAEKISAVRRFQIALAESFAASAQIQLDARDSAIESVGRLRAALTQEAQDRAFDVKQIDLEISAYSRLALTYDEQLQQTLKLNIARETASRLRRLEIEEIAEISRLNGLIAGEGGVINEAVAAQIRQTIALFEARRKAVPDEVISEQNKVASVQRLRDIQGEAQNLGRSINDSLTDAFMSSLDSANGGFKNLAASIQRMFRQMVLRPIIQAVLAPVSGAISATLAGLGLSGPASASTGGGGIGNLLGLGNSAFNALSGGNSLTSGLTGAVLGNAGAFGYAAAVPGLTSFGAGSQAAMLAAQTGIFGAEGLAATASSASFAGAAGLSAIGTAIPYIGLALAAASMLGLFGKKKTSAVGTGYQLSGSYSPAGLDVISQALTNVGPDTAGPMSQNHNAVYNAAFKGLTDSLERLLRPILGDAASAARTATGSFAFEKGMNIPDADTAANMVRLTSESIIEQLIPSIKDLKKADEDLVETAVRLSAEMELTDKILEFTGKTSQQAFGGVGVASLEMRDKLVQLMGGLQTAAALTADYYQNFHSESERHALDLKMVNDAMRELGIQALPSTRAQFRALVEAQDLSTDAGKEMFAALMQLAPAFAAVTQQAGAALSASRYRTAVDYARALAQIGGIPGHAGGLPYVPYDNYLMRAHVGEAVLTSPQASRWRSGEGAANDDIVYELRGLRQELAMLRQSSSVTAASTRKTADTLVRVTRDGESLLTEAVA